MLIFLEKGIKYTDISSDKHYVNNKLCKLVKEGVEKWALNYGPDTVM